MFDETAPDGRTAPEGSTQPNSQPDRVRHAVASPQRPGSADVLARLDAAAAFLRGFDDELADVLAEHPAELVKLLAKRGDRTARTAIRDRWMRRAAEHPIIRAAGHSPSAKAKILQQRLTRYHSGDWKRGNLERKKTNPHREDDIKFLYWEILRAKDWVLGEKQIFRILVKRDILP